jgi:hypothetical protein
LYTGLTTYVKQIIILSDKLEEYPILSSEASRQAAVGGNGQQWSCFDLGQ